MSMTVHVAATNAFFAIEFTTQFLYPCQKLLILCTSLSRLHSPLPHPGTSVSEGARNSESPVIQNLALYKCMHRSVLGVMLC